MSKVKLIIGNEFKDPDKPLPEQALVSRTFRDLISVDCGAKFLKVILMFRVLWCDPGAVNLVDPKWNWG